MRRPPPQVRVAGSAEGWSAGTSGRGTTRARRRVGRRRRWGHRAVDAGEGQERYASRRRSPATIRPGHCGARKRRVAMLFAIVRGGHHRTTRCGRRVGLPVDRVLVLMGMSQARCHGRNAHGRAQRDEQPGTGGGQGHGRSLSPDRLVGHRPSQPAGPPGLSRRQCPPNPGPPARSPWFHTPDR
jgi:hypothetical protein